MTLLLADSIFSPDSGFVRGKSLLIEEGVIKKILNLRDVPNGGEVMDLTGFYVSPPFCDYHLHFSGEMTSGAEGIAGRLNRCGVVRVYDGGDRRLRGLELKRALGNLLDIRTAGYAIYKKGSYGKYIGIGVGDAGEAKSAIDLLSAAGVDYIKVINSGIFMPESGEISSGGFDFKELEEIVSYAADKGLSVFCHANGERRVREAVEAGASAVVHGFYVSEETLSMMAESKTVLIPTINALYSLMKIKTGPAERKRTERLVDEHLMAVKKALDRGVRVLPGSDAGPSFIPYGTSYLAELGMLRKAGLSLEGVLAAAVTASLREGGSADFLVMQGTAIEKVFVRGKCLGPGDSARNSTP